MSDEEVTGQIQDIRERLKALDDSINVLERKLDAAIQTLPEKQKLVFTMKYFEELKYKEISEILGTSEGGLKASYHLAVKKIELFLNED